MTTQSSNKASHKLHNHLLSLRYIASKARAELLYLFAMNIISGAIPLGILYLSSRIIDHIVRADAQKTESLISIMSKPELIGLIGLIVIANSINDSFSTIEGILMDNLRDKLKGFAKLDMMQAISSDESLQVFQDSKINEDLALAKRNIDRLPNLLDSFSYSIVAFSGLLPAILLLLRFDWWVPFFIIITITPLIKITNDTENSSWAVEESHGGTIAEMDKHEEILLDATHAKEVRLWGISHIITDKYSQLNSYFLNDVFITRRNNGLKLLLASTAAALFITVPFAHIIASALNGKITVGDVTLFTGIMFQIRSSLSSLIHSSGGVLKTSISTQPLWRIIHYGKEKLTKSRQNKKSMPDISELSIKITNGRYRYPGGQHDVLHDINLTIRSGEIVALVGHNGAGKSTLINVICGFQELTEGDILINNEPLSQMKLSDYRQYLSAVFQDFGKFPYSLGFNIEMGALDHKLSAKDKESLLEKVGLEKLNSQQEAILDPAEEDGISLSGGQWQRIAIARAYARLKEAKLLILDEPTAALDPVTEIEIFDLFRQMSKEKASLIVTHRMALARWATKIIVLQNGTIVEEGNHDELLKKNGIYHEMFNSQANLYHNDVS